MSKRLNRDDLERFHDYDIYVPSRTIYVGSVQVSEDGEGSGCDPALSERVSKNLHFLDATSWDPITILLNNMGGDEYACFAIIDAIQACQSEVTVKVLGAAMSAGSLILQAADRRLMTKHAVQMIHYGTWGNNDHSKTLQKLAKEGARIDRWMEEWYMAKIKEKHPTFKRAQVAKLLDHDTYLTAEESVALGLADEVV